MITTGIILSKNGANSYNVNIPDLVDGNETFNFVATVCSSINNKLDLKINDVVYINFENNRKENPIIVGLAVKNSSDSDIKLNSLEVNHNLQFPQQTSIGSINSTNLESLAGVSENIQNQLDNIDKKFSSVKDNINKFNLDISNDSNNLSSLQLRIRELSASLDNLIDILGDSDSQSSKTVWGRYNKASTDLEDIKNFFSGVPEDNTVVDLIDDIMKTIDKGDSKT